MYKFNGKEMHFTGDGLAMLLEDFQHKNMTVDVSGCVGTLKFLNDFDAYLTECKNGKRILWLEGEDEDNLSIDVDGIASYGKDPISESIDIQMDNGIDISIYQ